MELIVHKSLNDIFETMQLIRIGMHEKDNPLIRVLGMKENQLEIAQIFHQLAPIYRQYVQQFMAHYKGGEGTALVETLDNYTLQNLVDVLVLNPHWLTVFDGVSTLEVQRALMHNWFDETGVKSIEEIVSRLAVEEGEKKHKLSQEVCWEWLLIYANPRKYFSPLIALINANLPAYYEARGAIDEELYHLLEMFKQTDVNAYEELSRRVSAHTKKKVLHVYPTLIQAFEYTLNRSHVLFAGIHLSDILEGENRKNKSKAIIAKTLKMLSEQNKLEIIAMLRDAPKYNNEIAGHLGISPATTKYHLLGLEDQGLIIPERRNGKIFYSLNMVQAENVVKDLSAILLE